MQKHADAALLCTSLESRKPAIVNSLYHEAASAEPLKAALQIYGELGIVRWARRFGNQGEPSQHCESLC